MIVLHGNNLTASRNALNVTIANLKSSGIKDIAYLNGEKLELSDLKQALESQSLFGSDRLIVIENLLSRIRSKARTDLLDYLKNSVQKEKLILWEKKIATAAQLKNLPSPSTVKLFKISPKIFKFLDSIAPKNTKQMLLHMHECIRQESAELAFYMFSRRVSQLIIALDLGAKGLNGMQQWQKTRLVGQAKRHSLPQLLSLHHKLYELDKSIKTGQNILPLASMLDLVICEI